ncbi:hypothetical protein Ciccas_000328 [Cichlidogyrus casuarinus]|uniref:Uncharacterized protein n=1 Tax=Cichlidogyrus casuarinus TaxID=1844966 RepID=A0ABD2QR95_9PLAT
MFDELFCCLRIANSAVWMNVNLFYFLNRLDQILGRNTNLVENSPKGNSSTCLATRIIRLEHKVSRGNTHTTNVNVQIRDIDGKINQLLALMGDERTSSKQGPPDDTKIKNLQYLSPMSANEPSLKLPNIHIIRTIDADQSDDESE